MTPYWPEVFKAGFTSAWLQFRGHLYISHYFWGRSFCCQTSHSLASVALTLAPCCHTSHALASVGLTLEPCSTIFLLEDSRLLGCDTESLIYFSRRFEEMYCRQLQGLRGIGMFRNLMRLRCKSFVSVAAWFYNLWKPWVRKYFLSLKSILIEIVDRILPLLLYMCEKGVQVPAMGQVVLICFVGFLNKSEQNKVNSSRSLNWQVITQSLYFRRYLIINDKLCRAESLFKTR